MRDRLFRLLFPMQYNQIKRINELLVLHNSPDFALHTPEGVYLRDVHVYVTTDSEHSSVSCQWLEVPLEG